MSAPDLTEGCGGSQIVKSTGEGSRGGHVTGHTASGKPEYDSDKDAKAARFLAEQKRLNPPGAKKEKKPIYVGKSFPKPMKAGPGIKRFPQQKDPVQIKQEKREKRLAGIKKSGTGEGSRGGVIIGHTKSGKPIYQYKGKAGPSSHPGFTPDDHRDAVTAHEDRHAELQSKAEAAKKEFHEKVGKTDEAPYSKEEQNHPKFSQASSEYMMKKHLVKQNDHAKRYHAAMAEGKESEAAAHKENAENSQWRISGHGFSRRSFEKEPMTARTPASAGRRGGQPMHEQSFDTSGNPNRKGTELASTAKSMIKAMGQQFGYAPPKPRSESVSVRGHGEGSRGGTVVGHTKSGKPIYQDMYHSTHREFSSSDHGDAVEAHKAKIWDSIRKRDSEATPEGRAYHASKIAYHQEARDYHRAQAGQAKEAMQ